VVKRVLLLLLLLLIPLTISPATLEDSFLPPDLAQASMLACGIGRNADASVDAILGVSYVHEVKSQWRALMARHTGDSALDQSIDACIDWWKDMKKALHAVKRP
jgi:hypothetical protein